MQKILLLAVFLFFSITLFAQTGSISGNITDKNTKESIVGATVVVVGTYNGTKTDIDGNYKLVNLKVGDYSIKITSLGYKETIYNGIKVINGVNKAISIQLSENTTELGAVEILGQKTVVDLETGRSGSKLGADDIKEMSAKDVQSLVATQAGVSQNPDGLQIRGGRVYETQYMIDGINAQDALSGTGFGVDVGSNAIKDIEVITGGVSAEYGDGTSGLVLTRIKEGGDKPSITGSYTSDNLGFNEKSSWNTDNFDISLGTPVPFTNKKVKFFTSVNVGMTDEFYRITASQLHSSLLPKNDSILAPRQDNKYSNTAKLTIQLAKNQKLSISNQYSVNINQNTRTLQVIGNNTIVTPGLQYLFSLNMDNAATYTQKSALTIANYTNVLSSKKSFDVSVGRLFTNLRADANGRPFRAETVDKIYDAESIVSDPVVVYNNGDSIVYVNPGPGLFNNGGLTPLWHDHYSQEYTFKAKFNYQPNTNNFFTFGIEHKEQEYQWVDVSRPWIGAPIRINDSVSTPSTSIGKTNDIWHVKPATGGLFAQDELRYKGIIASFGIRLAYWAPGKFADNAVNNPNAPVIDPIRESYKAHTTLLPDGRRYKFRLLPKLRVSFPISDNNVLFFNYGHQWRLPHPRFVYAGLDPVYQNRSFLANLGNPDLNPEVTVSYEVGLKTQITSNSALTVSAFYNDKYDYIVTRNITVKDQTGRFVEKSFSINQDYARVQGIEIGYTQRLKKWLNGSINGAYQAATGKSNSAQESLLQIQNEGQVSTTKEQFLAWDRPFDVKLMFVVKPDSLRLGGMKIRGIRFYAISTYKSGLRYTPFIYKGNNEVGRPIYEQDDQNPFSKIGTAWYNTDFRLTKDFRFSKKRSIGLSIEMKNAFNNKNAAIINGVTGGAYETGDDLPLNVRDPKYPNPQDRGIPATNPSRYLAPRQILAGVVFNF